jgi:hypothetical protein
VAGRLLLVVRLGSDRARQAVRQGSSLAKKQECPPAFLVVVPCWSELDRGADARSLLMTSQGSPHARFRRALLTTKDLTIIDAAAAELGHRYLEDALRVLIVMAENVDPRFDRAAGRFAARDPRAPSLPSRSHRAVLGVASASAFC